MAVKLISAKSASHGLFFGKPDTANDGHEAPRWRCLCNGSKNTNGGGRATTSTNVLKNSGPATVAIPLVVAAAWPPPPAPHKTTQRPPLSAHRAPRSLTRAAQCSITLGPSPRGAARHRNHGRQPTQDSNAGYEVIDHQATASAYDLETRWCRVVCDKWKTRRHGSS